MRDAVIAWLLIVVPILTALAVHEWRMRRAARRWDADTARAVQIVDDGKALADEAEAYLRDRQAGR